MHEVAVLYIDPGLKWSLFLQICPNSPLFHRQAATFIMASGLVLPGCCRSCLYVGSPVGIILVLTVLLHNLCKYLGFLVGIDVLQTMVPSKILC